MQKKVSVIGMGRFGNFFSRVLSKSVKSVTVYCFDANNSLDSLKSKKNKEEQRIPCDTLAQCVDKADWIFLCVPIRCLRFLLTDLSSMVHESQVLIDTCSVKEQPAQWMSKIDNNTVSLVATHPLFGPDSYDATITPYIVTHPLRIDPAPYKEFTCFLDSIGLTVVPLDPSTHDKHIAMTQGLTHFIGRALSQLALQDSPVGTVGYQRLCELITQTCNDTEELFLDMYKYNIHSVYMLDKLCKTFDLQRENIKSAIHDSETHDT